MEVFESHTGDNIRGWVKEVMEQFGIENEQIFALAIDSAGNVTKAMDDFIDAMTQEHGLLLNEHDEPDEIELDMEENDDSNIEEPPSDDDEDTFDDDGDSESGELELSASLVHSDTAIRVHCVAHRSQLGVVDFLYKKEPVIQRLVTTATRAMAALSRSTVLRRLAASEVVKLKKPALSQQTRWSSTYRMLSRLLDYEDFCNKYASSKYKSLKIRKQSWDAFRELVVMLKPIQEMTTKLQHQELTVPDTVFYWVEMMESLNAIQDTSKRPDLVKKLIAYMKNRDKCVFQNGIATAGTYLGKELQFILSTDAVLQAKEVIRMVVLKKWDLAHPVIEVPQPDPNFVAPPEPDQTEVPDQANEAQPLSAIQRMFQKAKEAKRVKKQMELAAAEMRESAKKVDDKAQERISMLTKVNGEFDLYETEMLEEADVADGKPDAFKYWKDSVLKFPTLAPAALDIICAPMTEVSVERLFSHLGYILNPLRNSLVGEILDDILLLRLNRKFAQYVTGSQNKN